MKIHGKLNCPKNMGFWWVVYYVWHWVIYLGKHSLVRKLIQAGADINAQDDAKRTPLFYAIFLWNNPAAKILIEYEADLNQHDVNGESPLALAIRRNLSEIETLLKQKSAVFHPIQLNAEMVMPIGHRGAIKALVFSADGRYFVSASEDQTIILWDTKTWKKAHTFKAHTGAVLSADLSPDGKYLVSGSKDSTVRLWDILTGTEIRTLSGHNMAVSAVRFSGDGKLVASGSHDDSIKIWDIFTGELVNTFQGHADYVKSICFSKDGKLLLSGSDDKTVRLWDVASGKELRKMTGHSDQINTVSLSLDGKYAVSGGGASLNSKDNTIKVWEVATGKLIKTLTGHIERITGIEFMPDSSNRIVSISSDHTLREWNLDDGNEIRQIKLSLNGDALALSPDSRYALVGQIASWQLLNLSTGKMIVPTNFSSFGGVKGVCFVSNEHKELLLVSYNGGLKLWDLAQGKIINDFEDYSGWNSYITCLPDKQSVWIETEKNKVQSIEEMVQQQKQLEQELKDIDPTELGTLDTRTYENLQTNITQLSFATSEPVVEKETSTKENKADISASSIFITPDEKKAISIVGFAGFDLKEEKSISDHELNLIDTKTGNIIRIFDVHEGTGYISAVSFSPDGKTALSTSSDYTLNLLDIATGKELKQMKGGIEVYSAVSFTPNGRYAVTGSPVGDVSVWDLEAGKETIISERHGGAVSVIRFSPDGKRMLTGSADNTLKLWDARDISYLKVIYTFAGHTNWVTAVDFSPTGKYAVSGSIDGTVKLWNLKNGKEVATLVSLSKGLQMKITESDIQMAPDTDWLIVTPDMYYTCSKDVQDIMSFKKGIQTFLFDQFDVQYNRPDKVLKQLGYISDKEIEPYKKAYLKRLEKMGLKETMFGDDFHAPEITVITEDATPVSTDKKYVTLKVRSTDTEERLKTLNVWVNGVPDAAHRIDLKEKKEKTDERELSIELSEGVNTIQLAVQNDRGAESLKKSFKIKYEGKPKKHDLYIVGIGVARYQNNQTLAYMDKDVIDLIDLYKKQEGMMFKKVHSELLTNDQVTHDSIMNIKSFLQSSKVDDTVIVFFSGHGGIKGDKNYLSTYAWDDKQPSKTGLAYTALENLLDNAPARKKLLLVNACHSGEYDADIDAFNKMQEIFADLRRGSGSTVISSSSSKEYSYTDEKEMFGKNSAFGYALLSALNGKKGRKGEMADANGDFTITVSELKQYVDSEVFDVTSRMQRPSLRQQNLEYDFPVWSGIAQ
ncbi:MAG: hypothetical protein D3911_03945 [Candidatus Electrothrix sp. AW3_4]|nr:hypothetical protein [Candidatus Electrothrix gigas]